jgi:ribosomal protein L11
MQKILKIQIKLLLNTKEYKQTYNLSTILGQQGVNISKFINLLDDNLFLKKINYRIPLNINILIFQDKTFDILYKNFNSCFVLKHFFFF